MYGNMPAVVAVSGPKNSGKTFLIERLVERLVASDIRFGVIKHDPHGHMHVDHEGKDSWRYRSAGASAVAVAGPLGVALFDYTSPFRQSDDIATLLRYFPSADLILAEGFKDHPLPRLVLFCRSGGYATDVALSGEARRHEEVLPSSAQALSVDVCFEFVAGLARRGRLGLAGRSRLVNDSSSGGS